MRILQWSSLSFVFVVLGRVVAPTSATGHARSRKHTAHRVILRYSEENGPMDMDKHVQELVKQSIVVKVQPLRQLRMAVVSVITDKAAEDLMEEVAEDPRVEVAVLDTKVSAFDFKAAGRDVSSSRPVPEAECSAHPACNMRNLVGNCCPASDGTMLSCCSAYGPNWVSLRTAQETYIAVGPSGEIFQVDAETENSTRFEIKPNTDGSVSFKSVLGGYLHVEADGNVSTFAESDDELERNTSGMFEIVRNENDTISLRDRAGRRLLVSETSSRLTVEHGDFSKLQELAMADAPNVAQRFAADPSSPMLWGMHHWAGFDIDAPEAWKIWNGELGQGITVAVIDTGIDYTHPDLKEQMWVNPLEIPGNGIDDDGNGYVDDVHGVDFVNEDGDPMDDQLHGTHCAGTIAGVGNNGIGVTGVCWRGVRLMALKFLSVTGGGKTSDAVRAIDYAVAHGAKITSNSWGGGGSNPGLRVAIERAEGSGMLFTAAAGNEGANNDVVPSFPANYDVPNIISVASTTWLGEMSDFSCYGNVTVDVAAPGSSIYSTAPGGGYKVLSGTSMATPHVTGLAALVWLYRPKLSALQVKEIIVGSVRTLPSLSEKVNSGGLINAKNALEAAWSMEPPVPPEHAPQGISFKDADSRKDAYAGSIQITTALNETDVDYYRVYFVSSAGFQLEALGEPLPATGESELTLEINGSFAPGRYAHALVAVSGRASGEMPALLSSSLPHVVLHDYVMPESGARAASWSLLTSTAATKPVNGTITIMRAKSETSITSYNVYWYSNDKTNTTRGAQIGSISAYGFQEPSCSGSACGAINISKDAGVYQFDHMPYASEEKATISVSGPGNVTVTFLDTEENYDVLQIDSHKLSGNMSASLPWKVDLPRQPVQIRWSADESVEGKGWRFEFIQHGQFATLGVEFTELQGVGFEIVPCYDENELDSGALFLPVVSENGKLLEESRVNSTDASDADFDTETDGRVLNSVDEDNVESMMGSSPVGSAESEPWLKPKSAANGAHKTKTIWAAKKPQVHSEVAFKLGIVRANLNISVESTVGIEMAEKIKMTLEHVITPLLQHPTKDVVGKVLLTRLARNFPNGPAPFLLVDFEVEPADSTLAAVDLIEARLITMSTSGRAVALFQKSLVDELPEIFSTSLVRFSEPQQINPKMLMAQASEDRETSGM